VEDICKIWNGFDAVFQKKTHPIHINRGTGQHRYPLPNSRIGFQRDCELAGIESQNRKARVRNIFLKISGGCCPTSSTATALSSVTRNSVLPRSRRKSFQFFNPVQHDMDFSDIRFMLFADHEGSLAIWRNITVGDRTNDSLNERQTDAKALPAVRYRLTLIRR